MMELQHGRTAIVTGATSGIGAAVAEQLFRQGYKLVITGRREQHLKAMQATLDAGPADLAYTRADALEPALFDRLYQQARECLDARPDAVVLCAGRGLPGTLLGSDPGKWKELLEINVLAMMHHLRDSAQQFVTDAMADDKVRDIVVIGSTIGRQVSAFNPVYGATKFALHALVEGLRQEVCDKNIRVSLIEPGFVVSEFQRNSGYDMAWFKQQQDQFGPFLSPKDIAETVSYVLSLPKHVHLDDIRIRPTRQRV
jgi:NADP-dependent 3-hydroxy acid dehydrogenase YdfG